MIVQCDHRVFGIPQLEEHITEDNERLTRCKKCTAIYRLTIEEALQRLHENKPLV